MMKNGTETPLSHVYNNVVLPSLKHVVPQVPPLLPHLLWITFVNGTLELAIGLQSLLALMVNMVLKRDFSSLTQSLTAVNNGKLYQVYTYFV